MVVGHLLLGAGASIKADTQAPKRGFQGTFGSRHFNCTERKVQKGLSRGVIRDF